MKLIIRYFILIMSLNLSYCQDERHLVSPTLMYLHDIPKKNNDEKQLFNNNMINLFFANKVGTAFGGSNDLSLQKFYTSIDAGDKSISVGANFDSRKGNELKKMSLVFSGSFKIKSTDKFATIYQNGVFQKNNIGSTFKISYIGNGIINYKKKGKIDRKNSVLENRVFLIRKYDEIVDNYNKTELEKRIKENEILSHYNGGINNLKNDLKKKYKELYIEMAKEEIDYLEKNNMYHYLFDYWYSLELFAPFGENNYKTTTDLLNKPLEDKKFYAFNTTLSLNTMLQFSSGESIFIKIKGNLKNNNNIIVNNLSSTPFQTSALGAGGTVVVTNSFDGYNTDFEQFLTKSFTLEPTIFTLKNTIGFSPSIEYNQGKYNKTNWKLGIPISLKDKDGKPKVNFELQWKEVNTFTSSSHYIGISANFLFGELIN